MARPAAGPLEALPDSALSVLSPGCGLLYGWSAGPRPRRPMQAKQSISPVTSWATGGAAASRFRRSRPEDWSRNLLRRGWTGWAVPGTGATNEASTTAVSRPSKHPHRHRPSDSDSGIGATTNNGPLRWVDQQRGLRPLTVRNFFADGRVHFKFRPKLFPQKN